MRVSVCIDSDYVENLVSVIIPSYQSQDTVLETIDSVLNQTYQQIEILVIDDGSTDDTRNLVSEKFGNSVIYIYQGNRGLSAARNTGLIASCGEYIQFLDADDILYPIKIEQQIDYLRSHPNIDIINSHYDVLREGKIIKSVINKRTYNPEQFAVCNIVGVPFGPLLRRKVAVDVGGFDEGFDNYCADWEFWMRAYYLGFSIDDIQASLGAYRINEFGLTHTSKFHNLMGDIRVMKIWADYYQDMASSYHYRRFLCVRYFDAALALVSEKGRKYSYKLFFKSWKMAPFRLKPFLMAGSIVSILFPSFISKKRHELSVLRKLF